MVSLVDIGDLKKEVSLRGKTLEVKGLSAEFIVGQLAQSLELRMVMAEKKLSEEVAMALVAQFPDVMAACIAEGLGEGGNKETIVFARTKLGAGETALLIAPILELTFPQGVGSFVEGLTALAQEAKGAAPGAPGWAADTKSPALSKSVSAPDTMSAKFGGTLPADSKPSQS